MPVTLLPIVRKRAEWHLQGGRRFSIEVSEMIHNEAYAAPKQSTAQASGILQRRCDRCSKKKAKGKGLVQRTTMRNNPVMDVPPIVHEVLCSPGQPLDRETRSFMESRFSNDFSWVRSHVALQASSLAIGPAGDSYEQEADRTADFVMQSPPSQIASAERRYDFSHVRVHTDAKAGESARAVNALAYTHGWNIAFAAGRYAPETASGLRLLAHELSHVTQQGDVRSSVMMQRAPQEDVSPSAGCNQIQEPPPIELWSNDPVLNEIRSEAPGENRVLLRRGQTGETVGLVQRALLAWGCQFQDRDLLPRFGADGDFGAETEGAVHRFQNTMEIASDGLVGPITLSRLDAFVAFGSVPEFPSTDCKVIPPDVPREVIQSLADLGYSTSSDLQPSAQPVGELAVSAGIAGIPILCKVGGAKGGKTAPKGICAGTPQHVASIGNATFALCDFINGSRMTAGAIPLPRPGNEAGFVEMRALGIALFGTVGSSLPTSGPGSNESDWQHGFIQTVRNLKYTASYQRGWSAVREVSNPSRDATGSNVPEPWYSNQSLPVFSFQVGNQIIRLKGPIGLGPESIGTDPVGIMDDPRTIFVDTVPIDSEPECPCSFLQSVEAKGELDTWLVVTPSGKGQSESDLAFLKHAEIAFDLKADKASNFNVQGTPTMRFESGRGSRAPVLIGLLANDHLKKPKIKRGTGCPVTIPGVKCPVESPKGPPRS